MRGIARPQLLMMVFIAVVRPRFFTAFVRPLAGSVLRLGVVRSPQAVLVVPADKGLVGAAWTSVAVGAGQSRRTAAVGVPSTSAYFTWSLLAPLLSALVRVRAVDAGTVVLHHHSHTAGAEGVDCEGEEGDDQGDQEQWDVETHCQIDILVFDLL